MKITTLSILLASTTIACESTPPSPPRNFAVEVAQGIDADLKCYPLYIDAGPELAHVARCRLSDKTWARCQITLSTNLQCGPLINMPPPAPKTEPPPAPKTEP